ncbi:MAG: type III-B CRISPR module-associated protein Cmr3 [Gammaproteobacteria bacterium]|nr:type III-B CRISPR module-associated protein Cmr3 [Gammaproteobacteria bacterium]
MSALASTWEYRFIEPLDVLILRGNKLFGDPGSYGECLVPPWPSVAAGAIRTQMLLEDGFDLAEYGRGEREHPTLGTPRNSGSFVLTEFYLARKGAGEKVEVLMSPPADLIIGSDKEQVSQISPQLLSPKLQFSFPLGQLPILAQGEERAKPQGGYWLTQDAYRNYLQGYMPTRDQLVHSSELWSFESRVGIGLSRYSRSVERGKLFTTQALVMHKRGNNVPKDFSSGDCKITDYTVGFVASVGGAAPPKNGLLRFGGDGRAASLSPVSSADLANLGESDVYEKITSTRRCRLVLTSPGLFPGGWKLPVTGKGNFVKLPGKLNAKLVSAAVSRHEIISGWDLASQQPKAANRVAPIGSVYWLEDLESESGSLEVALRKLVKDGLWQEPCEDAGRRAEGFNRCAIGVWS